MIPVRAKASFLSAAILLLAACSAREDLPGQPPLRAAQIIYQAGVPHTDSAGAVRFTFDPARSFFPIGIYHALNGRHFGQEYSLRSIAEAGFNTIHFWEGQRIGGVINAARKHKLRVIPHHPSDPEIKKHATDPTVLAWYLDEEPTQFYPPEELEGRRAKFDARRQQIRELGAHQPVTVIDRRPMRSRLAAWDSWAKSGDISAHFTYPFVGEVIHSLNRRHNIGEGISRAVALNGEKKPVWFVVQAFSGTKGWRMPSPRLLRAMTYSAVIHGATGLIYFALDSFVMRDGNVIGMAPAPKKNYGKTPDFDRSGSPPLEASDTDIRGSRALWNAMPGLTQELRSLAPVILSPTSKHVYQIALEGDLLSALPVRTILKESNGDLVLIAVNLDDVPLVASFAMGFRPDQVSPMFESTAPIKITSDGLHLRFAGFGVQVIRFRRPPPTPVGAAAS